MGGARRARVGEWKFGVEAKRKVNRDSERKNKKRRGQGKHHRLDTAATTPSTPLTQHNTPLKQTNCHRLFTSVSIMHRLSPLAHAARVCALRSLVEGLAALPLTDEAALVEAAEHAAADAVQSEWRRARCGGAATPTRAAQQ